MGSGRRQAAVLQHILEHSTPREPEAGSQHSCQLCPEASYNRPQATIPHLPLGNKARCPGLLRPQSCAPRPAIRAYGRPEEEAGGKMRTEAPHSEGWLRCRPRAGPERERPGPGQLGTVRRTGHTHCPLPPWLGDTTLVPRQLNGIDGPLQAKQDHCGQGVIRCSPPGHAAAGEGSTHP